MKEEILNVLEKLGFQLREFRNDTYGFQYEDINFLFLYDEDDNNFLNIAVPAVAKVCDDNVNDYPKDDYQLGKEPLPFPTNDEWYRGRQP